MKANKTKTLYNYRTKARRMTETKHLFPILDQKLIELLKSLDANDWLKPSAARLWSVKDIAAHLLDGNLRTLSFSRDKFILPPDREISSYQDLVDYLNQFNADWVKAAKRLSPAVLIDLLEQTGKEYSDHIQTLDPDETAMFSVAWAGEETSKNWFHIAREYTEKWHHQQQIRQATNRPGILTRELFYPFISTLLLGLPHVYRNVLAPEATTVQIIINSQIGGKWFLLKTNRGWQISDTPSHKLTASITLDPDHAWQLFTKALKPTEVIDQIEISGDYDLAYHALTLIAVMG